MAAGFLVIKAAKLAADGTDFDTIVEAVKSSKDNMTILVDAFNIPFSYNDPTKSWRKWISFGGSYHPYPALKITTKKADELQIVKGDHSAFDQFYTYCVSALSEKKPETVEEKKDFLHRNRIAVWDVIHSCDIIGSSDSSIRNVVPNDLSEILESADIRQIYCNGAKSYEYYRKYQEKETGRKAKKLPSTSPANAAWSLERLCEAWRKIKC